MHQYIIRVTIAGFMLASFIPWVFFIELEAKPAAHVIKSVYYSESQIDTTDLGKYILKDSWCSTELDSSLEGPQKVNFSESSRLKSAVIYLRIFLSVKRDTTLTLARSKNLVPSYLAYLDGVGFDERVAVSAGERELKFEVHRSNIDKTESIELQFQDEDAVEFIPCK